MKINKTRIIAKILNSNWHIGNIIRNPFARIFQEIVLNPRYLDLNKIEKPIRINTLSFENSSICNSKCIFCPHGSGILVRKKEIMSNDMFFRIIGICKKEGINNIAFGGLGEFLLDKQFLTKAKHVIDKGLVLSSLTSNGMLLDAKMSEALINLGMKSITISIDSIEKIKYEKIRVGLSYDIVTRNIFDLLEINIKNNLKARINLNVTSFEDTKKEEPMIIEMFKKYIGKNFSISFIGIHNWGGHSLISSSMKFDTGVALLKRPCERIFLDNQAIVRADGSLSICCNDYENSYSLGMITTSVQDLWNSPKMIELRKKHLYGKWEDVPICKNCIDIVLFRKGAWVYDK